MPVDKKCNPMITIDCPRCEGSGGVQCTKCEGSGVEVTPAQWIDIYRDDPGGPLPDVTGNCPRCYGMGEIGCPTCDAGGVISGDRGIVEDSTAEGLQGEAR